MLTRALLGVAYLLAAVDTWDLLHRVLDPATIPVPFAGLPLPPRSAISWLIGVWVGCVVALVINRGRRPAGAVLLLVMSYVLMMDQRTYSNHLYLLCLLVLILTLAEDAAARPLFRVQLTIVYAFATASKINLSFLSGAVLLSQTHGVLPEAWLRQEVLVPLALVAAISEAFLTVAFWVERLRGLAWIVGIGLHVFSAALITQGRLGVLIFGLAMVSLYPAFGLARARPVIPSAARDLLPGSSETG